MASVKTAIKLEGMKELDDALRQLPMATQGNVLKRAVSRAAADYADRAASLVSTIKSGKLKRNIKVSKARIINPGTAAFAAAMSEGATRAEAASAARAANRAAGGAGRSAIATAGPTRSVFYGLFQEFGTKFFPPKPFMRPAWDSMRDQMFATIKETLWDEIEKSAARLARKAAKLRA